MPDDLQARCELGQRQLMRTEYLEAEATLASAEVDAWTVHDFDTLSRLYMPLQEARRQRRQRCGEGIVCLNLTAKGPDDQIDVKRVIENYPHGQLLVAGWGTFAPAAKLREAQREHGLYVETFLGAVYPVSATGRAVVIAPLPNVSLPDSKMRSIDELVRLLPAHCIVLGAQELPASVRRGDAATYAEVMAIWERLHTPFLAAADAISASADPIHKLEAYRLAQRVDYACEPAHQKAADVAREIARSARRLIQ